MERGGGNQRAGKPKAIDPLTLSRRQECPLEADRSLRRKLGFRPVPAQPIDRVNRIMDSMLSGTYESRQVRSSNANASTGQIPRCANVRNSLSRL